MTRYAVLVGISSHCGFQQTTICDIYNFLKSSEGGSWSDREILILPEGVDETMLKFILRRVSEDGTDFLFLYFCGNENDHLTSDGFTIGGEKIKRIIIEETCRVQVTVFDACSALVSVDDDCDECEDFSDAGNCDSCEEKQKIAASRILSDEAFGKVNGSLWLNGCSDDGKPLLDEKGRGIYTAKLLESLCDSDSFLDFSSAHKNARFMCEVSFAMAGNECKGECV